MNDRLVRVVQKLMRLRTGRTVASLPITGTSYKAIVGGWNDAIAVVDGDIAATVVQIGVNALPPSR